MGSLFFLTDKIKIVFVSAIGLVCMSLAAAPDGSQIIAEVGDESITFEQLSKAYSKNLKPGAKQLNELSKDSVLSFFRLYSHYRLKVQESINRGYREKEDVAKEIDVNRRRLTESELFNRMLIEPTIAKTAKRRGEEFKMAYILLAKDTINPDPRKLALDIIGKLDAGEDFGQLAREYSSDQNTAQKDGILDMYITSGRVQPELEDALYTLRPGDYYKEPVETDYGFFILKLVDLQPRIAITSAHILIDVSQVNTGDWEVKEVIADSLYNLLQNGGDFGRLAKEFSGDPGSADKGGILEGLYVRSGGFIGNGGKLVDEYEKAVFELKDGEISKPVKTRYGYHIIKRLSSEEIDGSEELEEIKQIYKRTSFEADKKKLIDSLSRVYGFSIDEETMSDFLGMVDNDKNNYDSTWAEGVTPDFAKKVLFKFNDEDYTVQDYIREVDTRADLRGISNKELSVRSAIDRIVKPELLDIIDEQFYEKYISYRDLSNEFRDGILLYHVETEEVWNKLKFDSVLAKQYFIENGLSYKTDHIVDFTEIYLVNEDLANKLKENIDQGADIEALAEEYTERAKYRNLRGKWEKEPWHKNKMLKQLSESQLSEGAIIGPIKVDMGYSIIRIDAVYQPRDKTFEEAIPDFATKFQDHRHKQLSSQWISKLESKYEIEVYEDKLEKLLKD